MNHSHEILTPRLRLRRFQLSDFEAIHRLEADAETVQYTSYTVPQTREQSLMRLETTIAKEVERAPLGVWAVEFKDSKKFVGWSMLLTTNLEFPELGFMIDKELWGQGLTTEIADSLVQFGKSELKLKGIVARTNLENVASIRVLEKVGFRFIKIISAPNKVTGGEIPVKLFEIRWF